MTDSTHTGNSSNPWNITAVVQPSQDPTSVFYIHPSDANTSQLVSVKFNGAGFSNWKRSMLLSLSAKNKLGFVDGSVVKPVATSVEFKAWERCNDLVCSWLLNNLDESISKSVLFFKTAREIWIDLEEIFGYVSMTQLYSLEQQLSEMTQGNKNVSEFFTEIKTVWDAMNDVDPLPSCTCNKCTCNVTQKVHRMQQDHRLLQFMMKLNDKYANVRGNVLMQQPLPSLSNVFRMFSQEERHQEISHITNSTESLAFLADGKGFPDSSSQRNFKTGNQRPISGYNKGNGNSNGGSVKKGGNYYCTHCKISGHSVERCFKIHGYPPNFKDFKTRKVAVVSVSNDQTSGDSNSASISVAQYQQLMDMLSKNSQSASTSQSAQDSSDHALLAGKICMLATKPSGWLIDSGATDHICSDLSSFHTYEPVLGKSETIVVPDGRHIPILHVGTVQLHKDIILQNVLHIPEFHYNLISVKRLCQDFGCSVTFNTDTCYLQDHLQKELQIPLGKLQGGLYSTAQVLVEEPDSKKSFMTSKTDLSIWHLRLGHLPSNKLKQMSIFSGLKNPASDIICQICPLAKHTRVPFTSSTIKTKHPFQLIHLDVWGPYKVKTYNGCNQFVTIVDDYSRFTWIHLIKARTDCVKVMTDFLAHVETQYKAKVEVIRSDNAPELGQGPMKSLYLSKGILHQTSCSNTPQQNGVVERKHRHLLESARSLFFQSKIPAKYWSETVLCATYLINRSPLQTIQNDTPYFRLTGDQPSIEHLKVFGCLCYASTSVVNRNKFDPRARPCVFMGYSVSQKGYKLLDISSDVLFVSRDVTFHESHFPYHTYSRTTDFPTAIYIPAMTSTHSSFSDTLPTDVLPSEQHTNSPIDFTAHSSPGSTINSDSSIIQDLSPHLSTSTSDPSTTISVPLRKSSRISKPPTYLSSYKCNTVSTNSHWCNLVQVSSDYSKCSIKEPSTYNEAATQPLWIEAMSKEIQALHANHTWDLVTLPPGKKPIGSKWVYKVKLKSDGSLERCKARLVAKGYNQRYGIDYEETFSPVVKMATVRILLSLAANRNWELHQLDVNNAFLHGVLKEEVYMRVPEGIHNPFNLVCLLRKSIYGLKQASREWHAKLVEELLCQGFVQSKNDYSLFIKRSNGLLCIAAVYVDDVILTGDNITAIHDLKAHLNDKFGIKDLGRLHYFFGIEVSHSSAGITLCQQKFANQLLRESGWDFSTSNNKACTTLPVHLKLTNTDGELLTNPETYRSLVGKLNYLTNTRPDLSYTVQTLSQFMHAPRSSHWSALHHTLKYLAATVTQGILLHASDQLKLQAFSDADWASCVDTRRSVTGYILLFGQSPITWKSKKQSTISRSSAEAEYRAMASAAAEVTWVVRLLEELGVNHLKPVTLHCDNQSALYIAKNPVFHERTKHIELDCHFTRDKVLEGLLQLTYLPTRSQLGDVFTKVSPSPLFHSLLSKLGMLPSQFTPPNLREGIDFTAVK